MRSAFRNRDVKFFSFSFDSVFVVLFALSLDAYIVRSYLVYTYLHVYIHIHVYTHTRIYEYTQLPRVLPMNATAQL